MNTVKKWMRVTRALGFALVVVIEPASAAVDDSLIPEPANPSGQWPVCSSAGSASVIAYSSASAPGSPTCGATETDQRDSPPSAHQPYRFAEPASGSFWSPPADNRRYSF